MGSALKSTHPSYRNEVYTALEVFQKKDGSLYTPDMVSPKDYKPVAVNEKTINDNIAKALEDNPGLAIPNFTNSNNHKRADVSPEDKKVADLLVLTDNNQKILGLFTGKSSDESFVSVKGLILRPNSKVHDCDGFNLKFGYQGGGPGGGETTYKNQIAGHQIGILNEHVESHIESMDKEELRKNAQYAALLEKGPSKDEKHASSDSLPPPAFHNSGPRQGSSRII